MHNNESTSTEKNKPPQRPAHLHTNWALIYSYHKPEESKWETKIKKYKYFTGRFFFSYDYHHFFLVVLLGFVWFEFVTPILMSRWTSRPTQPCLSRSLCFSFLTTWPWSVSFISDIKSSFIKFHQVSSSFIKCRLLWRLDIGRFPQFIQQTPRPPAPIINPLQNNANQSDGSGAVKRAESTRKRTNQSAPENRIKSNQIKSNTTKTNAESKRISVRVDRPIQGECNNWNGRRTDGWMSVNRATIHSTWLLLV